MLNSVVPDRNKKIMNLKTKVSIASAFSVAFILLAAPLAFFANHLSGLSLILGLACGMKVAKWKKEMEPESKNGKRPVTVPTIEAKKELS